MQTFLLLVLVQIAGGAYDTKMAPMPSLAACEAQRAVIVKQIPAQEGISYALTCIQARDTQEQAI